MNQETPRGEAGDVANGSITSMLADRIEAMLSNRQEPWPFMVVDAYAEAWKAGYGSDVGEAALRLLAITGRAIVCSPLGMIDPVSPVMPKPIRTGMPMAGVQGVTGLPHHVEQGREQDVLVWIHDLPHPVGMIESDGRSYEERDSEAKKDPSSTRLPWTPLATDERLVLSTTFHSGIVISTEVVVKRQFDLDKIDRDD